MASSIPLLHLSETGIEFSDKFRHQTFQFADGSPYTMDSTRLRSIRPYRMIATEHPETGPYRCAVLTDFMPIVYKGEPRWLGARPSALLYSTFTDDENDSSNTNEASSSSSSSKECLLGKVVYQGQLLQRTARTFHTPNTLKLLRRMGEVVFVTPDHKVHILMDRDFAIETLQLHETSTWKKKDISSDPSSRIPVLVPREEFDLFGPYCAHCNLSTLQRCSKCKQVFYCSRRCQRQDAKQHRFVCTNVLPSSLSKDAAKQEVVMNTSSSS
jgi:hypothetical protein